MVTTLETEELNFVEKIIRRRSINTVLHPICSLVHQKVIGYEALSRGEWEGREISPYVLFKEALEKGKVLELDRLCREKALYFFSSRAGNGPDGPLLFLNIDTSILTRTTVGSDSFRKLVKAAGLEPERIVIEILESRTDDEKSLVDFVNRYRDLGFKIALDDVGMGSSNLDRIPLLRPSVVKIDRYLVDGMHREMYKRAVFRGLTDIAHEVGAMVVAEGIEKEEDAIACLEDGADGIQGFFFSKPESDLDSLNTKCREKLFNLARNFRLYSIEALNRRKERTLKQNTVFTHLAYKLEKSYGNTVFLELFEEVKGKNENLECFYILDSYGIQLSPTVGLEDWNKRGGFFGPAEKGSDHGMKRYYISLASGLKKFVSEPYLSSATGKVCQTLAGFFRYGHQDCVLCIDFSFEA
ncbi:MAG: EAL domain-containing protein [Chitinispirillaceae bacterium]